MTEPVSKEFTVVVRKARREFLNSIEPLRPELYRYCRSLTRNVWDAEDLVQDVLLKAFAKLADVHWQVDNPRAYLFRVATNHWIDVTRKAREDAMPENFDAEGAGPPPDEKPQVREAITRLASALPPAERAAVLLKDVFDFSLEDAAGYMKTTVGAVKSALHRGRAKLKETKELPQATIPARVETALLDRWCDAFNARDLTALAALMLEDATAEVVGMVQEYGRDQIRDGSLYHTVFDEDGEPKAERREFRGEPIVVLWYSVDGKRVVRDVLRFISDRGGMAELRYYYFCPETLAEVVNELGLPLVDNGYRYPTM
ncbi:MAG: sigma-70 family RNA polymerase sigma factor [Planctomycetes bacterium]|nr:sigma-70 family RNA polymerase sigma factor [Planctomycetota bacterium]